jgi:hypothetical protein
VLVGQPERALDRAPVLEVTPVARRLPVPPGLQQRRVHRAPRLRKTLENQLARRVKWRQVL